ncbi:MAG: glycosyltransferase [Desulfobacterota bacterium]|nr:glycosyltransferase [Thermodesulfobacteriota bacterium]
MSGTLAPTIAFIFNHHFFLGGGEASLYDLIQTLNRDRFSPLALVPARGDILERMKARGIPAYVSPLPSLKRVLPWHPPLALGQLVVLLRRAKPAILHANGSRACLYAVLAGQLLGVPVLWHVRETLKDLWIYDRFLFTLSRAVVCVSESVKAKRFDSLSVRWKEKIDVVYNGVDSSIFCRNPSNRERVRRELGIEENEILFGVVANYVPLKGQDFFLQGAAALKNSNPALPFKVLLIGRPIDTLFLDRLRNLADELLLEDRVLFRDHTDRIAEIYSALDIFVLPSRREGFSRSILEAMSTGLPVLATQLSEIQEAVVEGQNGLLVPHGDVETLRRAALTLAKDRGLRETMGALNREKVEDEFSLIAHARSMETIYSQILSDPRCQIR